MVTVACSSEIFRCVMVVKVVSSGAIFCVTMLFVVYQRDLLLCVTVVNLCAAVRFVVVCYGVVVCSG